MDRDSIDKKSKHLTNVDRYLFVLRAMPDVDKLDLIERAKNSAAARWDSCYRSYSRLFSVLNKNSIIQKNSFDIYAKRESVNDTLFETMIRLQREKDNSGFSAQPYVVIDKKIVDQTLGIEVFNNHCEYSYGTHHNQRVSVAFQFDGNESRLLIDRINGYKTTGDFNLINTAIMLAAIEDVVEPMLTQTEDTLIFLWQAMTNKELNSGYMHFE